MTTSHNKSKNISIIKNSLWIILGACFVLEMILFPSEDNFTGCVVSVMSTLLYFKVVFTIDTIRRRPVSFVASIYPFLFMYLPLPATLLDGNEMSHDMSEPMQTFGLQFLFFCCILLAFALADRWSKSHSVVYSLLRRCGYFKAPSNMQLWALGVIGLFFKLFLLNSQFGDGATAGAGTLSMFSLFLYSPICIYFKEMFGLKPVTTFEKRAVWAYMIILSLFLISTNSRSQMLSPFVVWVCCYMIQQIYKKTTRNWFTYKKLIIGIVAAFILLGPATDMGYAMLVVRGERVDMDFTTLLQRSIQVFQDKQQIEQAKAEEATEAEAEEAYAIGDWNESYVSSIFLNRLCNYRVADQSIQYAKLVGYGNNSMKELFVADALMAPVGPIAKHLTSAKKSDFEFSSMDYLYYLSTGVGLGGYKVGGDVGLGLATFGYTFFPLAILVYILVFILMNSVARFTGGILNISFITLISIYFTYFLKFQVANGLIAQVTYLVWSFWWTMFWYLVVYKIVRLVVK